MTESRVLLETVINNGYCIGCGACSIVNKDTFQIQMDPFGNMVAQAVSDVNLSDKIVLDVCPFSGASKNEDEISNLIFPKNPKQDEHIGNYIDCYAGFVKEDKFREKGSSGGMGKWLGSKLLEEGRIDHFVQLIPNPAEDSSEPLFKYDIFSNHQDVIKGSRSSYYPVSLDNIVAQIKEKEGSYAITGVPCFIKTIRLLSEKDAILKARIKYTIGIICGGMKSANHSKAIGWDMGVLPENLVGIDFRRKYKDRPASQKIYQVWSNKDNKERFKNSGDIFGTDWSGFFSPKACSYCDDVVSETADISIGDAWLPQFINDPKGTSIIIVRNQEIHSLLKENMAKGQLSLLQVDNTDVIKSQEGGFRQRREGLSYRLQKMEEKNKWYPLKRVKPNQFDITTKRKEIYDLREKISETSHLSFYNALKMKDLSIFEKEMRHTVKKYYSAVHGNLYQRTLRKIVRRMESIIKNIR